MSRPYLKNIRMSLCLLSVSSIVALSPELGFSMDQVKIEEKENTNRQKVIPESVKREDQNLDLDLKWDIVAQDHEKTAVRLEQILKDMEVEDIPSTKKDGLTYVQLILKHREVSGLCKTIDELNKEGLDISIKKNEIAQKLTELYGPLTIEFNSLGILQKIVALRKISTDLTLVLGNGSNFSDTAIIINNNSEKKPDILANFFAPSFMPTVLRRFRGIKFEKIILGDLPPKLLLDEVFLKNLTNLSFEGTEITFNDYCHFTALVETCFTTQEVSERGRKGPFHAVTISTIKGDIEEQKESICIEQETPFSSKLIVRDKNKQELGRCELTKEDRIHTLVHRHQNMLQLFRPHGFKVYVFKFPANEVLQPDYTNDNLVPQTSYPKLDASPYLWKAVFNPENKLLDTETNDFLKTLDLNALRPVSFEEFSSILLNPVEKKKLKPRKKKVNNKNKTTIIIEKNDLNDKSIDQILKEFKEIDKKKKNNNNIKINNNKKNNENNRRNKNKVNDNSSKKENNENNSNKKN